VAERSRRGQGTGLPGAVGRFSRLESGCLQPWPRQRVPADPLHAEEVDPQQLALGEATMRSIMRALVQVMVERSVCADDDDDGVLLHTRGQNRRGNSELILHRFLDFSRCLRLKLDKINYFRLS
jgi:hypothetical protein